MKNLKWKQAVPFGVLFFCVLWTAEINFSRLLEDNRKEVAVMAICTFLTLKNLLKGDSPSPEEPKAPDEPEPKPEPVSQGRKLNF